MKRTLSLTLLSLLFILAGLLHFLITPFYVRIMPPYLPAPRALVYISGLCEILGGMGVMVPSIRRWAGWGLIALLAAVYPANIQMFLDSMRSLNGVSSPGGAWLAAFLLFLRLPLQFVLVFWVYRSAVREAPKEEPKPPDAN